MLRCSTEEAIAFLSRYVGNEYYTPQCQEAHRMAIAALREQEKRRWIPVTERLPESGKDVLIITSSSDSHMAVWRLFRNTINGHPHWEDEVGDGLILEAATHWMPLPEPPKEKNE